MMKRTMVLFACKRSLSSMQAWVFRVVHGSDGPAGRVTVLTGFGGSGRVRSGRVESGRVSTSCFLVFHWSFLGSWFDTNLRRKHSDWLFFYDIELVYVGSCLELWLVCLQPCSIKKLFRLQSLNLLKLNPVCLSLTSHIWSLLLPQDHGLEKQEHSRSFFSPSCKKPYMTRRKKCFSIKHETTVYGSLLAFWILNSWNIWGVESDFLSAIAGRVGSTFRRVGSGPRNVTTQCLLDSVIC